MSEGREPEGLTTALARMARDLQAQPTVQQTLDRIAAHVVELVDGCEACGILVARNKKVQTLAATDNVARAADRLQDKFGEGPCFDAAYRKVEVYRIADMSTATQWPRFAPQAHELGVASMMGFLLFTEDDQDLGALNLYSSQPGAFTEYSEQVGWLVAAHAAVALSSARSHAGLWEAIGTRQDIGEALGILMERDKLSEQDAFDLLAKTSQDRNIKLRKLAQAINITGTLPDD